MGEPADDKPADDRRYSPLWLELAMLFALVLMIGGVFVVIFEAFKDHGYLFLGVLLAVAGLLMFAWFRSYKKQCNYRSHLEGSSEGFDFFGGDSDGGDGGDGGGGD